MTITTETARMDYVGTGIAGPFSYTFRVLSADDLEVTKRDAADVETSLVYPTDFSVTGVRNRAGGTITLTTALAVGETLTIRRTMALTQETDLRSLRAFLPEAYEDQFDRLVMIDQMLSDGLERSLRYPVTIDPDTVSAELPIPEPGRALGWNPAGTALENLTLDASAVAIPGESRAVTTLTAYLLNNRVFNIRDYGAAPAASAAVNVAAVNTAWTAAAAVKGTVFGPAGTYNVNGQLTCAGSNTRFVGEGRGSSIFNFTFAGGIGFYATGRSNVHIQAIGITGLLSMGIVFDHCTNASACHNAVSGCTSGAHATGYAFGIGHWVSDDVRFEDNDLSGNGYIGAGLSSDIQTNGNGANTGSLRTLILNNRCLSTATQTCIICYDVQHSTTRGNVVRGAQTGAGNNNGYGIGFYRTSSNSGSMADNHIDGNDVSDCGGTGIYGQACQRTVVSGNTVRNCGKVQDDTSLAVGGIAVSNCVDWTVSLNIITDCGKAGICIAGQPSFFVQANGTPAGIDGHTVTANVIDGVTTGSAIGILIRGPMNRTTIALNVIKGAAVGIGTLPTPPGRPVADGVTTNASPNLSSATAQFSAADAGVIISGTGIPDNTYVLSVTDASHVVLSANATATASGVTLTIGGIIDSFVDQNVIHETTTGSAIEVYGAFRTSFSGNQIARPAKHAVALVYGHENTVSRNRAFDGSVLASATYNGVYLIKNREATVDSNRVANTGAVGFATGVLIGSDCPNSEVTRNRVRGCLTANFNVDSTVAAAILFAGNRDGAAAFPFSWAVRQQAQLTGSAALITQWLLGNSGAIGSIGTTWSGAFVFLATNAYHVLGSDLWHQSSAATSKRIIGKANGDIEMHHAANGTADGTDATFWGTPTNAFTSAGAIKSMGVQVVGPRDTGWTAMTGTASKGGFATSTVTLVQLAQVVKAILDADMTAGNKGA